MHHKLKFSSIIVQMSTFNSREQKLLNHWYKLWETTQTWLMLVLAFCLEFIKSCMQLQDVITSHILVGLEKLVFSNISSSLYVQKSIKEY